MTKKKEPKTRTWDELTPEEKQNQGLLMNMLYELDFDDAAHLVEEGRANLNLPYNKNQWTPFMWICKECFEPRLVEKFLKLGGSVTQKNDEGETPLMIACRKRSSSEAIEVLLEYGSPINEQDCWGFTPLMRVITHSQFGMRKELAMTLIENGADLNTLTNCQGMNAVELLMERV